MSTIAASRSRKRPSDAEAEQFVWPVPRSGFCWDSDATPIPMDSADVALLSPPFLRETDPTRGYELRAVLADRGALLDAFMRTTGDEASLLRVADRFGRLLERGEVTVHRPAGTYRGAPSHATGIGFALDGIEQSTYFGESLAFWRRSVAEIQQVAGLWQLVESSSPGLRHLVIRDAEGAVHALIADPKLVALTASANEGEVGLSQLVDALKDTEDPLLHAAPLRRVLVVPLMPASPHLEGLRHDVGHESDRQVMRIALCSIINKHLSGEQARVSPRTLIDDDGDLQTHWVPSSLLAALWWTLLQAATDQRKFRRCAECGQLADATGLRRDWTMHATCASRVRQRRHAQGGAR